MSTALSKPGAPVGILQPATIHELDIFSQRAAASGLVPDHYKGKPGAVFIAVQFGSEIGLSPMQALNAIAVIGGRPTLWGDAMLALCKRAPVYRDVTEWIEGTGKDSVAWCKAERRDAHPVVRSFSYADAELAGLLGKPGPWKGYPRRMMQMRARSFALRDQFPDVLRGMVCTEEARDISPDSPDSFAGTTIDASAETPAPGEPAATGAPRRTVRDWLDELHTRLAACTSAGEVDDIATSEDVMRATRTLFGGPLDELNALLADAVARLETAEPDNPEAEDDAAYTEAAP